MRTGRKLRRFVSFGRATIRNRRRRQRFDRAHIASLGTIERGTKILVFYTDSKGFSHFGHWARTFAALRMPIVHVFTNPRAWEEAFTWEREYRHEAQRELLDHEAVFVPASTNQQVSAVIARMHRPRIALFVSMNNIVLSLVHCCVGANIQTAFIGHGDSSKASSYRRGIRLFDEVWIAGSRHESQLRTAGVVTVGPQPIHVGLPWISDSMENADEIPAPGKWLYAPTWKGYLQDTHVSSVDLASEIIDCMRDWAQKCANQGGIVKQHPWTLHRDKVSGVYPDVEILPPETLYREALNRGVTALISDISSVISETIIASPSTRILVYVPEWLRADFSAYDEYSFCQVFSSPGELQRLLFSKEFTSDAYKSARISAASARTPPDGHKGPSHFLQEVLRHTDA